MDFLARITAVGLAKLAAAALPGGAPVSLTHMAVGDGGGNPIPTDPLPTELVNEVYRDQINSLMLNPSDSTMMIAELVIPSDEGGFSIREFSVIDAEGDTFAIGNFPDTYKPIAAEGSTREMLIYGAMKVSDTALIELVIDASIVLATRAWCLATFTGAFIIPGGLIGQVLSKASNTDGDFVWVDPSAAVNITVDAIKEEKTATAGQDIFTLTTLTTVGVAVYVEGAREHNYTLLNATQVQLARTLPVGTKVLFVQNEPNEPIQIRRMITGRGYYLGQLA